MQPGHRIDCGLIARRRHHWLVVNTDIGSVMFTGRGKRAQTIGVVTQRPRHVHDDAAARGVVGRGNFGRRETAVTLLADAWNNRVP